MRLDGGTVFVGAQVSPHFDSMLVKLTCRGRDFGVAVRRARRALAEFRIRGVSTNIPFLEAVLADPVFQRGEATTGFIDERPGLLDARTPADRGTKLLQYLADVTVNQPHGPATTTVEPRSKLPELDTTLPLPRARATSCCASAPPSSPDGCASAPTCRSPTRPSATPTRACSPPGCAPATCSTSPGTCPG